jgi:twitching motility protein PilT
MSLSNLVFSDLFVADTAAASWFKTTPDSMTVSPIPPDCAAELAQLRQHLDRHADTPGFRVDWPERGGMRLRVERIATADAAAIFVCRRFKLPPGPLASLGVPAMVANKLLADELTEGLVVFFGKAGAGKSTTAASFIVERLAKFGGVCWTIENPVELALEGPHGKGWCYQTEVRSDGGIGPAVRHLMRATPNIILIGELRDGAAVREAIGAATSGHLVVATFHAADLQSGIARLARLAGEDSAAGLADALKVGVHLTLHNHESGQKLGSTLLTDALSRGTGTPPRVLSVEPLWLTGQNADGVRSMVRDGEFHQLSSEVERQRRAFMMKLP